MSREFTIAERRGVLGLGAVATVVALQRSRGRNARFGLQPTPTRVRPARRSRRDDARPSVATPGADEGGASTRPDGPVTSRWAVFAAFGLLAAASQILVVQYAPVTADASRHFGVSTADVGWLTQVFPLVYVILAIPAGLALDRFFRPALLLGATLTAVGAFLRLVQDDYTWAFIGQVVAAAGQPLVLNAIPGLAIAYLAAKDRAAGIALASSATFGGMLAGFLLGSFMPGEHNIRTLTMITAIVAMDAALALGAALHFVKPLPGAETVVSGGLRTLRSALRNRYLRRLCALVFIPFGTFLALATFVQPLLEPAGVHESTAGLILAVTMVAAVIGCGVVPVWADKHHREIKLMGLGIAFTAAACLHLAIVPSGPVAFVALAGVGFFLLPALPIVLSLSERHVPEAENTAAALVWMAGNLGSVVVATAVGFVVDSPTIAFLALGGITVLALPLLRWYQRLEDAPTGASGTSGRSDS